MPHIQLPEGLPGIRGPFAFRPETAKPLCELAEILLHTPGTLSLADRELIAAAFCMFNRDVDGLATWTPSDAASYRERAARVAHDGYLAIPQVAR